MLYGIFSAVYLHKIEKVESQMGKSPLLSIFFSNFAHGLTTHSTKV